MCIRKPKHITLMKHHMSACVHFQCWFSAVSWRHHIQFPCNQSYDAIIHSMQRKHTPLHMTCHMSSSKLIRNVTHCLTPPWRWHEKILPCFHDSWIVLLPCNEVIWLIGVVINRCHEPLLIMTVKTDLSCFTLECQPYHGIYFSPFMTSMNLSRFHSFIHGVWIIDSMQKLHWSWSNTHH